MTDFSLFRMPAFCIVFFAALVVMMAYFIPFAYCTQRAELLGVDAEASAFIVSILGKPIYTQISMLGSLLTCHHYTFPGISTMVGRLGSGIVAQIPKVRIITLHNGLLLGSGLSALFVPFCTTYITMCITAVTYGLCMGMSSFGDLRLYHYRK